MKTITLTTGQVDVLRELLPKIIQAPKMLDKREFTPTYAEVMALIDIYNQLYEQTQK